MRERPGSDGETSTGEEAKGSSKRIDLSVPQVAGSAVAAVVAAELASCSGVYGTILGAGVVSVIATCGGTLFQHFFSRTGEQFRDATAATRPREQAPPAPGEFTEGTVYRARARGRRRPWFAAAASTPSPGESASGEPSTTPTPDDSSATDPEPSASSRSGTAGPDRADPAAP